MQMVLYREAVLDQRFLKLSDRIPSVPLPRFGIRLFPRSQTVAGCPDPEIELPNTVRRIRIARTKKP